MSKLRLKISVSLDDYAAGPNQGIDKPLGIGGMRLHEWVYPLRVWREMLGLDGGVTNGSSRVVEESTANIGATLAGGAKAAQQYLAAGFVDEMAISVVHLKFARP